MANAAPLETTLTSAAVYKPLLVEVFVTLRALYALALDFLSSKS